MVGETLEFIDILIENTPYHIVSFMGSTIATKFFKNEAGALYYGNMDIDEFLQAKEFVGKNEGYNILEI